MLRRITFVTSYLKIYRQEYDNNKTFPKRLRLFMKLLDTGINMCLFTSPEFEMIFRDLTKKYTNLVLLGVCDIENLEFWRLCDQKKYRLAKKVNTGKDTHEYMVLMNEKTEFIRKSILANPFNTEYFSWIDFSIGHIFRNPDTYTQISRLDSLYFFKDVLVIPGCGSQVLHESKTANDEIVWRFAGGLFLGHKDVLLRFSDSAINHITKFLDVSGHMLWEVNYWAWLEAKGYLPEVLWYYTMHSDDIVSNLVSMKYVCCPVLERDSTTRYTYPEIPGYRPSSASYIEIGEKRLLNTRYVNYHFNEKDDFVVDDSKNQIKNINLKTILDCNYMPVEHTIMEVDESKLISRENSSSLGLEDIRLFLCEEKVKFIATNINYNEYGYNKMVVGDYTTQLDNPKIISTTVNTNVEKNWAPLPKDHTFIWGWNPYRVGVLTSNNFLKIILQKKYDSYAIDNFRGSTPFIEMSAYPNKYIGLVHYKIDRIRPTYYHILVAIDSKTLLPESYSDPFKFTHSNIEFCIGLHSDNGQYLFWISEMDRDPQLIKTSIEKIKLVNKF